MRINGQGIKIYSLTTPQRLSEMEAEIDQAEARLKASKPRLLLCLHLQLQVLPEKLEVEICRLVHVT